MKMKRPSAKHVRKWGILACTLIVAVASYVGNQNVGIAVAETFGLVFFYCLFYDDYDEDE